MVSVNQVKHFFLLKNYVGVTDYRFPDATPKVLSQVGDLELVVTKKGAIMFRYMGNGGIITSDYITPSQINYATVTPALVFNKPLKEALLTLNPTVNGGNPIAGEDYIVNILISNYIAMGDESTLQKFAAAHVVTGNSASDLYKAIADSFVRSFARDVNSFFKFYLTTTGGDYEITKEGVKVKKATLNTPLDTDYSSITATGVKIVELPQTQDYIKGEVPVTTVNFDVYPQTVLCNGDEVNPFVIEDNGAVAKTNSTQYWLTNAYEISDTEYFCAGERGDMLRGVGYPKNFRTKYLIDTPDSNGYDTLDISYYLRLNGVPEMRSNKQILIVA